MEMVASRYRLRLLGKNKVVGVGYKFGLQADTQRTNVTVDQDALLSIYNLFIDA